MTAELDLLVTAVVDRLADPTLAESPADFPRSRETASHPGLYAWWADDPGVHDLQAVLGEPVRPLIYAGQAGASSSRAAKPSGATLESRIRGNHIGGNTRSSTFRKTLASVLQEPLGLTMGASALDRPSNERLSGWVADHLRVVIAPVDDPEVLHQIEAAVLVELDPPLNLRGVTSTLLRREVARLRTSWAGQVRPG